MYKSRPAFALHEFVTAFIGSRRSYRSFFDFPRFPSRVELSRGIPARSSRLQKREIGPALRERSGNAAGTGAIPEGTGGAVQSIRAALEPGKSAAIDGPPPLPGPFSAWKPSRPTKKRFEVEKKETVSIVSHPTPLDPKSKSGSVKFQARIDVV